MLISVCQRTFNGAHAFQGTAIQIANFIQMKGAYVCRFCFRGLFVRSFAVAAMLLQRAAKGALFAFVRCYCLRVGALVCACTLFEAVFCRLRGFFCFCNTLHTLHAFARLCGFSCSRVCSLFCAPSVRIFNASDGQILRTAGGKVHSLRGCVL